MNILFYLLFLAFSFGQLGRVSFFNQQANFYIYEVLMVLLLSYFVFKNKLLPFKKYLNLLNSLKIFIFVLFFTFLLNLFKFNVFENIISGLYLLRVLLYISFFFYFYYFLKKSNKKSEIVKKSLFFSFFLIFIFSLLQYLFYPDLRNLIYLGWDPHLNRAFGVFFDTSVAAAIYGLIFLYSYFNKKPFFSVVFLILFILTFSRSAYLALFIVAFTYLLGKKEYRKLIIFFLLFISILLISPKNFGQGVNLNRMFSIESRLKDYQTAIIVWKKSPLFGFGYNRIKFVKERMNLMSEGDFLSHSAFSFSSSYLIILVTTGIFGLISFIGLLLSFWKRTCQKLR